MIIACEIKNEDYCSWPEVMINGTCMSVVQIKVVRDTSKQKLHHPKSDLTGHISFTLHK